MNSLITVHVSDSTLEAAKHTQGANFFPGVCALLSDGYVVEIESRGQIIKFSSVPEFTVWFKDYTVQLRELYQQLEARGDRGNDWGAARNLEDALSSNQVLPDQIAKAEALLSKYQH